jgi:hypothetical protein
MIISRREAVKCGDAKAFSGEVEWNPGETRGCER